MKKNNVMEVRRKIQFLSQSTFSDCAFAERLEMTPGCQYLIVAFKA